MTMINKHKAILFLIFLFSVIVSRFSFSQNILNYYNIRFHKLNTDNGLPNNLVFKIQQDNQGFIWIATANGFVRFDGIKTKVFQNISGDSTSLPHNIIRDFIIISDSLFYLACDKGIVKFFPIEERFEFMHSQKYPKLKKHSDILCKFFLDSKKHLWILNDNVNLILDTQTDSLLYEINYEKCKNLGWPNSNLTFQLEDINGNFWFSNSNSGFYRIQLNDKLIQIKSYTENYNKELKIPINTQMIYKDKAGNLFFSNNGLYLLNKDNPNQDFQLIDIFKDKKPTNNTDFAIFDMIEDKFQNLWISTNNYGIFKYNTITKKVEQSKYSTVNYKKEGNKKAVFWLDKDQNIWLLSDNSVIANYNYKTGSFTEYKHNPTNPDSPIKSIFRGNEFKSFFQDQSGVYWIIADGAGINFFDLKKSKFPIYQNNASLTNSLSSNNVSTIYEDKNNYLWVGCDNGVNVLNLLNGEIHLFNPETGKEFENLNNILSIIPYSESEFWFSTIPLKRYKFDYTNKKLKLSAEFRPNAKDSNSIAGWVTFSSFKDQQGDFYFGTSGQGVECYINDKNTDQTGRFIHFPYNKNNRNGIAGSFVFHFMEDKQNRLWISTNGGLSVLDKERKHFTNYFYDEKDSTSISFNSIKMCYQDKKGRIWIATEGGGFNQFIEGKNQFIRYNKISGFATDNIFGIFDDNSGSLWMSSDIGIIKFSPETKQYNVFTTEDGVQSKQFKDGVFYKSASGKVYFGGNEGINHFYPDSIKLSDFIPKLCFVSLKIFNKEVEIGKEYNGKIYLHHSISNTDEITLSYKDNVFSIEFAALDFAASKNIKYTYFLEGVNKSWIETSADDRTLNYTNLTPGSYILKVKSTNSDGVWCDNSTSLIINITPPWWQTWWFRIIIIIAIIISAIAYYKYKIFEIQKKNQELERKVAERTNEVMQQKEELQQQAEELEATNEELTAQSDALKMSNEELNQKNEEINKQKDELEKSFKISQVISEFGQRVTSTFDLESINEIVYGYICSIMPTDAFGIGLYNSAKNEIEYIGFIEEGQKIENFSKKLNTENSLSAWCFNNQKLVFINDIYTEFIQYIPNLPIVSTNKQPLSIIHLPLSANERKLGIIVVNSFNKNAYSNKDLIHLQSLASYITIAIDNANAYKTVNAQKEKLLELDNFKEAMTGMIVHDLKNPLNAIIGLSSMNPEDEMMQMVNSAGNQMLNLVLNILDVQKFENTQVKLNLSDASLYELADEANRQVSLLIKQKKQVLNINILPQTILNTDAEVTIRVFVNMLTNAIKYTPNGGSISINQEAILFNEDDYDKSELIPDTIKTKFKFQTPLCLISVSDTGQGIPADKLHLVFEKFGQVEAKKSGGVRSTGLGMTFCKMVVEAHGGAIWIASEVGKGTNFYFTLPYARKDESIQIENLVVTNNIEEIKKSLYDIYLIHENGTSEIITESEIATLNEELKILVADDDKYSIEVIKNCLSTWGRTFLMFTVGNGKDAVEAVKIIVPDIILLDWEMPQLDGLEALKQIKTIPELLKIPVAMVTSRSGNSHIQLAFDAGASDYIKKPIDKTEALFRIQTLANLSEMIQITASTPTLNHSETESLGLVLIVDDVFEIRQMIKQVLQKKYLIIEAENGIEGINKAKELLPDIIISDINMPGSDGLELCKSIKSNIATSHIPVILLTAQAGVPSNIAGLEAGADAYLTKPVRVDLLSAAVKNQIENREKLRKLFSRIITSEPNDREFTTADEKFISQCIKTVEENITNTEFHLESFIKEMAMSYGQLYGKIKFLTNLSIAGFIRDIRMKRAKQILDKEKIPLKELIVRVGFENTLTFIRVFKREFGITPAEYARKVHSNNEI